MTQTATPDYPTLTAAQVGSAELRAFHLSSEPQMVAILAGIEPYVAARSALIDISARLDRLRAAPPKQVQAVDVLRDAVVDLLDRGEALPDSLIDLVPDLAPVPVYEGRDHTLGIAVVANGRQMLMARVEEEALRWAMTTIQGRLDGILGQQRSQVFAGLTERLRELVDRARKVLSGRGRIDSADQAIEQDRVVEYKAGIELGREYAELRRMQQSWHMSSEIMTTTAQAYRFFVANPLEVAPHLARVETAVPYTTRKAEGDFEKAGVAGRRPWPSDWADAGTVWWFAAHPLAEPWAPTEAQAQQLHLDVNGAKRRHELQRHEALRKPTAKATKRAGAGAR